MYFTECKQENVLDKIKAEIEMKIAEPQYQHEEEDWQVGLIMAETIIDKYKANVYAETVNGWELVFENIPEEQAIEIWRAGFRTGKNKFSIETAH